MQDKNLILGGMLGGHMGHHLPRFHNFSWVWNGSRNFLVENFVFFESKKFLTQGVCLLKFFIS